jgi:hypothetical protein
MNQRKSRQFSNIIQKYSAFYWKYLSYFYRRLFNYYFTVAPLKATLSNDDGSKG